MSFEPVWCAAPAKVNLCLYVGPTRPEDGRHELVTVMDNGSSFDLVGLEPAPVGAVEDQVVCPGVEGPNLALDALKAFRATTGWDAGPALVRIRKQIPVAGGMAGGSADAAATLRLAAAAARIDDLPLLERIAATLGADVPSQVRGGRVLAEGAGERLSPLPGPDTWELAVFPLDAQLSAGAVYAELDRQGGTRSAAELARLRGEVLAAESADGLVAAGLRANDLEPAAVALCPQIADVLATLRGAGAEHAMVSGSGPTVVALFPPDAAGRLPGWLEDYDGGPWTAGPLAGPECPRTPMPGRISPA